MWWLALPVFASDREIVHWVKPAYPDDEIACKATLSVASDGAVTVNEVRRCKPYAAIITDALSQWRYAPAATSTEEEVSLSHQPGEQPGVKVRNAPSFADEAEEAEGKHCIINMWVDEGGHLTQTEITNCEGSAKTAVEAAVFTWKFETSPQPWSNFSLVDSNPYDLQPIRRIFPQYPQGERVDTVRCRAIIEVEVEGLPIVESVLDCPEPFAAAASDALAQWRWPDAPDSWMTIVAVVFQRN